MTPGSRIGSYDIVSLLGEGGMGQVYRARDSKLKRDVAIKVLPADVANDRERLARFQREAEVLASLNHPHIAQVYGIEEPAAGAGQAALVMELVEGEDLAQRLSRGPIPIDEALGIAKQIAEALECAHEQGIIHRDLKPANIKLRDDGTVKVLDFGLAKALDTGAGNRGPGAGNALANSPTITSPAMTMHGVILGTAAYMSPEQAKGKAVDRRADIWAFACVLYEMLTGQRAFKGDDITDIITSVMRDAPDWSALPANTPPMLRTLLRRCLEKDVRRRVPHAAVARIEIEEAMASEGTAIAPTVVAGPPRRSRRALAAAVAVVCAIAAGWFAGRWRAPSQTMPPLTFHVDSAGDTRFSQRLTTFLSLSPDGRQLAYVARGPKENEALWIHSFATGEARLIPNTNGSGVPVWSPDSRSVAFRIAGALRRVDVGSGAAQTICDCTGNGGTWNQDDVILFSNGAIMRVPAAGGTPEPVTTVDDAAEEMRHMNPHFLPDGRHFLFTVVHREIEKSTLRVGELGSTATQLIGPITSGAQYTEPGYLVYAQDARLLARPFDASTLRWTGEPTVVASMVRQQSAGLAAYSVTPGGMIAFDPNNLFMLDGDAVWLDRQGNEVGRFAELKSVHTLSLSADERILAVEQNALSVGNNVWLIDGARGTHNRLSFERGTQGHPVFSPDGTRVAYFSGQPGTVTRLHIKAASGTREPEPIAAANAAARGTMQPTDWSRDGRFLFYEEEDPEMRQYDLKAVDVTGTQPPMVVAATPFQERLGQLSPDGRWVAYQSNESGRDEIYVVSFPDRSQRTVVSSRGGQKPRWGRDELLFVDNDGMLTAVSVKGGATLDVGAPVALFALGSISTDGYNYAVSRDGTRFLVARPSVAGPRIRVTVMTNWPATQAK